MFITSITGSGVPDAIIAVMNLHPTIDLAKEKHMRSAEISQSGFVFRLGVLFLLVGLLFLSAPLFAQEKTGTLTGVANDATGAVLPGVTITITNKATNRSTTTITGSDGSYFARSLEPGRYSVKFDLPGFSASEFPDVTLLLGQTLKLDTKLQVGGVTAKVEVTDVAPLIDTTSTVIAHNVTSDQFDHLPKARGSNALANLAPSVNSGDVEGGIQVGGASAAENSYTVDGIVTNSVIHGGARQDAVLEYIQEVQVKTNGINAEYGGALGGVVSAVTKSGGNEFHGEGHYYYSGNSISAAPVQRLVLNPVDDVTVKYFQDTKPPRNVNEFGGQFSGPIKKDKAWFLTSVSPRFARRTQPYAFNNGLEPDEINQKQLFMSMFNKLSLDATNKVKLNFTWLYTPTYSTGSLPGFNGFGPNYLSSNKASNQIKKTQGFYQPQSSYTGNLDIILNHASLLSTKGGYFWDDYHDTGVPNIVSVTYQATTTGVAGVPADKQGGVGFQNTPRIQLNQHDLTTRAFVQTDYALSGNMAGFHNFKAGIGVQKTVNNVDSTYPGGYILAYWGKSFTSNVTHVTDTGQYGYYEWTDFGTRGSGGATITSLYGQDQWTINNRLTLNLGVRTEREVIPSFRRAIKDPAIKFNFKDKIAPRLGASYDLNGDGKVKIYGSWGRYYDWTKYELARGSFGGDIYNVKYRSLDTTDVFNLAANGLPGRNLWDPSNPGSYRDRRVPNFNSVDPDLKPMSQDNISVGTDYQWNAQTVLTVQYVHNNLRRTIEDLGAIVNGDEVYAITNPGEGIGATMDPAGTNAAGFKTPKPKRQYDALEISLNRRFAHNWFANVNYTYSRLYGNYSGLVNTDEIRTPTSGSSYGNAQQQSGTIARPGSSDNRAWDVPEMMWDSHGHLNVLGNLATDRPHVFKAYGSYQFPMGTEIDMNFLLSSGTPVSTYLWDTNSAPVFPEGRGDLGRTPVLSQTDMVVAHEWKLPNAENKKIRFEFNMLNVFNQKTSRHVFNDYNRQRPSSEVDFATIDMAKGYDYKAQVLNNTSDKAVSLDPRFKQNDLFNPGFAGRFGVKFIF
jgi:hypothetical protein